MSRTRACAAAGRTAAATARARSVGRARRRMRRSELHNDPQGSGPLRAFGPSPRLPPVLDVLRPGVLDGLQVWVTAPGGQAERLTALGATTTVLEADLADEDDVARAVGQADRIDVLVVDAAARFTATGGGMPGLRAAVDDGWNAV